eukprot:8450586-Ditylum_brightwellii.AAC.1
MLCGWKREESLVEGAANGRNVCVVRQSKSTQRQSACPLNNDGAGRTQSCSALVSHLVLWEALRAAMPVFETIAPIFGGSWGLVDC